MNHLEVLGLSIDAIEGQDDKAIKKLVEAAWNPLYTATLGGGRNKPNPGGLSAREYQARLNQAKNTLLDPQTREAYLAELRQSQKKNERPAAEAGRVDPAAITIEPHRISFSNIEKGGTYAGARLTIQNEGQGTLNAAVSTDDPNIIQVNRTEINKNKDTIQITLNTDNVEWGTTHRSNIRIEIQNPPHTFTIPVSVEVKNNQVAVDVTKKLSKDALILSAIVGFLVSVVLASNELYLADIFPRGTMDGVENFFWYWAYPTLCVFSYWASKPRDLGGTVGGFLIGWPFYFLIVWSLEEFILHYLTIPIAAVILTGCSSLLLWRYSVNSLTHDGITGKTQALTVVKMLAPSMIFLGLVLAFAFVELGPLSQPGSKRSTPSSSSNTQNTGRSRPAPSQPKEPVPQLSGSNRRALSPSSTTGNARNSRSVPFSPAAVEKGLSLDRAERVGVQRGLAALKYTPGQTDGKFGLKTRAALKRWQASKGYRTTGYLDRDQAEELMSAGRNARSILASSSPSYSPGKYQLAKDAPLLKEPRDKTAVIAKLSSGTVVNITEESGGYLKVVSKSGKPPGWLHRAHVTPLDSYPPRDSVTPNKRFRDCPTCPQMVVVPAGSYQMGSPLHEKGRYDNEGPPHAVTISQPFAVGVYEVTRKEFSQFVATGYSAGNSCTVWKRRMRRWLRQGRMNWRTPGFQQTERDPVVCVSWEDAQAYVAWLKQNTGKAYRLLSEAEWEYVARAGTRTQYWWGDMIEASQANYDLDRGRTVPVGSFRPNAFGLYDVHGNVSEWVQDCWNSGYRGAPSDGQAWEQGCRYYRVLRGGSWGDEPGDLRSANRGHGGYPRGYSNTGFRVARSLP